MLKSILLYLALCSLIYGNILQDSINNAPSGATIKLDRGIYLGNIYINKPLTLVGEEDGVIIQGDGTTTTLRIESSNVILKNLTISNSGNNMISLDAAISMKKVQRCQVIHCKLLNSLYGIDMMMVQNSLFSDNYITSKDNDISLKGDALKVWYSSNNIIQNNTIEYSRDVTLTYSHNNIIKNNHFTNNRFALHVSHSNNNKIKDNSFKFNSVSIMIMGAKDTVVKSNRIESSKGAAGIGIVIKGVSNFILDNNIIRYNAQGIYVDNKGNEKGMQRYITNNIISYNKEAMHFHAVITNNTITHNQIFANIEDSIKDIKGIPPHDNIIEYNYWDRYEGFDRDKDNIGDTPHQIYQYADQLWHYNNKIKFFYASPIMTLLNFLTAVAPFVEPVLLLEDKHPIAKKP